MNNKITPGTLCLIIAGLQMGKYCVAERYVRAEELLPEVSADCVAACDGWLVSGPSIVGIVDINYGEKHHAVLNWSICSEQHLLPISPDEVSEIKRELEVRV